MDLVQKTARLIKFTQYYGEKCEGVGKIGDLKLLVFFPNPFGSKIPKSLFDYYVNTRYLELVGNFPENAMALSGRSSDYHVECWVCRIGVNPGEEDIKNIGVERSGYGIDLINQPTDYTFNLADGHVGQASATFTMSEEGESSIVLGSAKNSIVIHERGIDFNFHSDSFFSGSSIKGLTFENPLQVFVKVPFLPDKIPYLNRALGALFVIFKIVNVAKITKTLINTT